jgi:transcription initiation factor TFIID subunit 1
MLSSLSRIKSFGIEDQRSTDKINTAFKRYKREHSNDSNFPTRVTISNLISEELQLTTWNLSQSFITAKQTQGRLFLEGLGDPTNGFGGMSYVKKPLKISRYDKDSKFMDEGSTRSLNMPTALSGSEADLRKLKLNKVNMFL